MRCYENECSAEPVYEVLRRADDPFVREVRRADGEIALTVFRISGWPRTKWTVNTPGHVDAYLIAERRRDALWRRTIGRLTKIQDSSIDIVGLVVAAIAFPALLMPANRLEITDRSGGRVGLVTIPPSLSRPRDSYCLYLDSQPLPLSDVTFALLAIAVVQDLK
ncbi:hypothetical protein GCM10009722_08850 [Williamsia deligens]|nr:hypothetical protein [Williamsia deligens]